MTIHAELGRNGTLAFEKLQDIQAWLRNEREAWSWLNGRMGSFTDNTASQIFSEGWNAIEMVVKGGDSKAIEEKLAALYGNDGKLLLAHSKCGQYLRRIAEREQAVANAAVLYFVRDKFPDSRRKEPVMMVGALAWALFAESLAGVEADVSVIRQRGNEMLVELTKQTGELAEIMKGFSSECKDVLTKSREGYNSQAKKLADEHEGFLKGAKDEYDKLKEFYQKELALKAPVDYWAGVASRHRLWAGVWGGVFAVLLCGIAVSIMLSAKDIRDFLMSIQRETIAIALTLALGTITFWALRMVAKIFLSNYQRAVDAAERETMVKTFLALRREGNISEEQLGLVLAALFRPGVTGLVKDDSAPEYGVAALLSKDRQ